MLDKSAGSGRAPLAERGRDLYETPAVAVRALLSVEKLHPVVWEPACGRGAIARPLQRAGHQVYASDIEPLMPGAHRLDFLLSQTVPRGCYCVVTNPPYMHANDFVRRALALCPMVVMLLRLSFLESEGRRDILDSGRLARIHVFRNRLPMMHRDGWDGNKASSSMAFAWFVWDKSCARPTQIDRISWR